MEPIGHEVGRELDRFGPIGALAPIVDAWPGAVGPEIARNAWPARIARDGTLHVNTSSSAWAFELAHLERRIRDGLGPVAPPRLRFAVGPLPEPAPEDRNDDDARTVAPDSGARGEGARLAAGIRDESLRKVVAEAAAWSLANADSDRRFW